MRLLKFLFGFFILTSVACKEVVLLENLSQHDTNEVMVVLAQNGIKPIKESIIKQQETTWTIKVKEEDEEFARALLVENRLPKKVHEGLQGVCKETSMIPTPAIEKCQKMLALKGEIINALTKLPGVVNADVVLNIPDKQEFHEIGVEPKRPTASVVVEMGGVQVQSSLLTESKIQHFVANTVTGMDPRDVAVIISVPPIKKPDDQSSGSNPMVISSTNNPSQSDIGIDDVGMGKEIIFGVELDQASAKKFKLIGIVLLVFFIFLSIGLIFLLLRMSKLRQQLPETEADDPNSMYAPPRDSLPEQTEMDQLVEDTSMND